MNDVNSAVDASASPEAAPLAVSFVDGLPPRVALVSLAWPVVYQGRTLTAVRVNRVTVGQLEAYFDMQPRPKWAPMFADPAGNPLPEELIRGLDADDWEMIQDRAADFLPRSFRAVPESASIPARSDIIDNSSAA